MDSRVQVFDAMALRNSCEHAAPEHVELPSGKCRLEGSRGILGSVWRVGFNDLGT